MGRSFNQRYMTYTYHGETIKLPAVHVRLIGESKARLKSFALVDSGATTSFIPFELYGLLHPMRELGASTAEGAGGTFDTRIGSYKVEVLKGSSVVWSRDVQFQVPTEDGRIPYIILGRDSIFKGFSITFRENEELTVFRENLGKGRRGRTRTDP